MNRLTQILLLSFAIGTAKAAPISGKICVGTWNTQAEFSDVRVVQGSQRLYSSNFYNGLSGWTTTGGNWSTQNGVLRQTGGDTPAMASVGNPSWKNYTVTLKARKTGGSEGFLIGFGMPNDTAKSWLNIAGWGNTQNALEVPGVSLPGKPGSIVTNRWYTIKIEVQGSDIRCYLDNVKLFDTMRILDSDELAARRSQVVNSAGLALLPNWEQDQVRELLQRSVYIGRAARETFNAMPSSATFAAMTATDQAPIVRKINRCRLTWRTGWGFGGDAGRDNAIIQSVDDAVALHNSMGVFDHQLVANNSPGTPTADAGYDGEMRYGNSINYRVALHEISHAVGTGTYWGWSNLMYNGSWHGTYANLQLQQILGDPNAVLNGDGAHYWPFGLNYDSELGWGDDVRHVLMVAALRRDMGLNGVLDTMYTTDVPNGTYRLTPRLATSSAIEAPTDTAGAAIDIRAYTGSAKQKFKLEKQSDGTYLIRTTLASGRCVDLLGGDTSNGQTIQLSDSSATDSQRWYLIPMGDGWYKIAPKNNPWKTMDLYGVSSADGTPVKLWDFWGGFGQQFKLEAAN